MRSDHIPCSRLASLVPRTNDRSGLTEVSLREARACSRAEGTYLANPTQQLLRKQGLRSHYLKGEFAAQTALAVTISCFCWRFDLHT